MYLIAFALWALICSTESATDVLTRSVGYGAKTEEWRGVVQRLRWKPRIFRLSQFLTPDECQHLIDMAKPFMGESLVVDEATGQNVPSDYRTSTGTFLKLGQDVILTKIEERIARVTMIPRENQEDMQILRYGSGQKYEPHYDFFTDEFNVLPSEGGQRIITVLIYLTDVEEGGETVFPNVVPKVSGDGWSDCAKRGYAVRPSRGDALMFYGLKPSLAVDFSSLHGSCPTLKGVKWSATKWIHVLPFPRKDSLDVKAH